MIYKLYDGQYLRNLDAKKIAAEIGTLGVVVIRNSRCTAKEFADWSLDLGYHLSPQIWCTDREHSDLFWRVTNQKVDADHQGLLGDHELDWHCNVTPVLDGEEIVGLFGKTITYPTETWFCNSIPYWNQLSRSTQERYKKLTIVLDPNRRLGRIQPGWEPQWEKIYSPKIIEDIYKNRNTREIGQSTNIAAENRGRYKLSRGIIENARFVPHHPSGVSGLFFTPYEVHGFIENGEPCADSKEIYWKIWNEWVMSEKYTYKHHWQEGDIVLMDQTITIHRRPSVLKEQPRELLRIACWYKTENRIHFDHVL